MAIPNSYDILQAVIEATPDAIFVKDLEGRYVLVNQAAARFLERPPEEILGRHDLELYPPETAERFIADDRLVLESGTAHVFEGTATGLSTTQAYLVTKGVYRDRDGRTLGLFGISHDITELRRANESLAQAREALFRAQKMEAVGQLTGGIAHDFNNILAVILGNAELLKLHLQGRTAHVDDLLDTVLRASLHGRELIGHLLAFSRKRQLNPQPTDVNGLVERVVRLLGRTLGASIQLVTRPSPSAGAVFVDAAALEAAVLNIALNARDAMADGGRLTIRTGRECLGDTQALIDDVTPGAYGTVIIEDTGCGMTPEVLARVFEPFFTTKAASRGTGLGLSMVYGFARQSGGTVVITSTPGKGTVVRMLLPSTDLAPQPIEAGEITPAARRVSRTILIVEDDGAVRTTVRRQLETLGHRVLAAEAPTEALMLLQAPGAPEVLLTDVVLGGSMNGVELAAAAHELRPALPVVFMSGYTAVADTQEAIRRTGAPLVNKPATLDQLQAAIELACREVPATPEPERGGQ